MPNILTLFSLFVSFFITLFILPYWIRRAHHAKLIGPDVHKKNQSLVAELGGLSVISGFLVSLLFFIATKTFVTVQKENLMYIFATIVAILIATMIGLVDDILGWKIGLRARYKVALTFFISLPIVVINAGQSIINIPLLGPINLGLWYPLLLVPLALMGCSNGFNMIAGYNGLEAGMGILILTTLSMITYKTGNTYVSLIGMCMVASLVAFYIYNKYPAKIFPGDTLTYPVGALIAIMTILGNIEKYSLILFIPYFLELILKARGKLVKESFAKVLDNGTLENQYDKWYGLEHVAISLLKKIRGDATEKSVVYSLYAFEACFCLISLGMFFL